ncbi:hypothetical protein L873DRAFT_549909 [Choiromyces venosus 120613-1]|uniref:Rap-GAP domain-containing protein n=1 Tax=Choiromyces venosus 120613-1 TaxID=1336337 RepID=A0A3N4K983_9PEZI|nr:hypothetical protein L873DRAFT_549909 [Choiromyces venosus 120613-1]
MPSAPGSTDPPQLQDSTKVPLGIASVFQSFRRLNRGSSNSLPATPAAPSSNGNRSSLYGEYFNEEAVTSGQILVDKLRANNSLNDRISAAEALRTIVADYPVSTVTEIWTNAQDLTNEENPPEARQAAFKLLTACIKQYEPSSLDRIKLYRTVALHSCPEDFFHQLQALIALTNGGRDLSTFQREIGGLLSRWLRTWFKESTIIRQTRKRDRTTSENITIEEFCLKELFQFTTDIIKFNFKSFEEREVNQLLTDVLSICKKTTSKKDIECSIAFIETLITYGYVPRPALTPCIEVLCGAYATLRDLTDATWNAVSNLCKSYMAHNSILVLREILEAPAKSPVSNNTNTLRGAVWFLEKLLIANEKDGLPSVQFTVVMSAFQSALSADSIRLELEISRAIAAILSSKDVVTEIAFDEWPVPLSILVHCSSRATGMTHGPMREGLEFGDTPYPYENDGVSIAISQALIQIITLLEAACLNPEFEQTEEVMGFFIRVHSHLPNPAAEMVISYYATEHLCYPSCAEWLDNCRQLLEVFFRTRTRPPSMRISILHLIKDVYETVRDVCEDELLHTLVISVFEDFQNEKDLKVLEALIKIVVDISGDTSMELFKILLALLIEYIGLDGGLPDLPPQGSGASTKSSIIPTSKPSSSQQGSQTNIVTRGLVRIFIKNMNTNAAKSVLVYEQLVRISGSADLGPNARLTAMRLLFRLRADSEHAIFIVEQPESDHLASVLHRVAKVADETASITSKGDEESSSSSRSNRSNSVSQTSLPFRNSSRSAIEKYIPPKRLPPIWSYPETKALPGKPMHLASPVLVTFYDPPSDFPKREGPSLDPRLCIRMSIWMEKVIPIIQQGCDWEIYSYVLVHLSSQLSNKTAFRNCKAHINMLRSYVCDQLHTNRIPSTDLPPEVKKADIAVVLINLLTTLISYKHHFAKNETEGIVKAFQLGLHSWQRTAKPCIHALSICCYELPGSTSKFLPGILTKLSQIITSSAVSVHILEFLSALAKLPKLYSNFTEPDFRNIFGIAFRYIQHTKETTAQQQLIKATFASRSSQGQANPADLNPQTEQPDLPQYVLTLAYNVLTTWFLSLRLSERPKYVSWITRGLVLHDQSNTVDEQSQACIDMLQRFTFSDIDLKSPSKIDPQTSGIVTKNWLHGSSILSIQTAPDSGISRVVVRRASGTSYYTLKPESRDLHSMLQSKWVNIPEDVESLADAATSVEQKQDRVLPSHFLLQIAGGLGPPETRPILLPEDEKTIRALDVFDRIPVVDFHKIGVVYVGAGQTEEKDILSNAMGSPDYTDFIDGLGDLITLKGTDINTGGLDHENNLDGEFAFFWSDRITQIIFHITTMMPMMDGDPQCTMKKRHIGNDFVNIVFNNSGLPWRFGTIPSQFNFVSIIITPEARSGFVSSRLATRGSEDRTFYRVQMVCKEGFSEISPAQEPKIVSDASLPAFVRNLALNASVYSHVYNEGGGEHISNWRHRLRSITKLRERISVMSPGLSGNGGPIGGSGGTTSPGQNSTAPGSRRVSTMSAQTSASDHSYRNSAQVNGDADQSETEDLLMSLDFSRFT